MGLEKNKNVVILIMVYQDFLTELEEVSLKQCLSILQVYPIRIVKPSSLDLASWTIINQRKMVFESFPDKYFKGIGPYSRLLLSPGFYKRFDDFEYLLIYQLDAFVFRDELNKWCSAGYDYMGAPWFNNFSNDDESTHFMGVGNGGFSLRRVKSHIRVLNSFSYLSRPRENWQKRMSKMPKGLNWLKQVSGFLLDLVIRNNTYWLFNSFMGFEDQFWGIVAVRNFKWFHTPDCKVAMAFSFEMQPRRVFEMNAHNLPFGCHAWWKYDLDFWRPHIEKYGYRL